MKVIGVTCIYLAAKTLQEDNVSVAFTFLSVLFLHGEAK